MPYYFPQLYFYPLQKSFDLLLHPLLRQILSSLPVSPRFFMDTCRTTCFLDRPAFDAANIVEPLGKCHRLRQWNVSEKMHNPRKIFRQWCSLALFPIEHRVRIHTNEYPCLFLGQSLCKPLALDVLADRFWFSYKLFIFQ